MGHRIDWLDTAKGIGIILVVAAHCMDIERWPFQIIYVFHMPLFFILSGYLFQTGQDFTGFLKKRLRSLIVPYCIFFAIGMAVTAMIPLWRANFSVQGLKDDLWLADPNAVHNSSIWFLVCLFWVQLFFGVVTRLPAWLWPILCVTSYMSGILYSRNRFPALGYSRLPLDLDVVPVAALFFAVGFYFRKYCFIDKLFGRLSSCICFTVGGAFLLAIFYRLNGYVNLHGLSFGNPVFYIGGGLAGSICVIGLSKCMEYIPANVIKRFFTFYGENSLVVLGLQSLLIRIYIVACNQFGDPLSLYHFSAKHTVLCTALLVFGVFPIICRGYGYIRPRWGGTVR